MMIEADYLLALNAVSGIGNSRIRKLLEYFHSAKRIFKSSKQDILSTGVVSQQITGNIKKFPLGEYLKKEYASMERQGARFVTFLDDAYPENLRTIEDAPVVLYYKGQLKKEQQLSIAIVGSRRASFYGKMTAEKIAARLAELGITVVSGMARGIDSAAHQGALKAQGCTIAVLGCGLNHTYPPENKKLEADIVDQGAVLSEFAMDERPVAFHFPRRNRIISGLSLGVVVVEASKRSGALITSDFALEQGREVFAVPGKVDSPNSFGVHNLIRNGAKLIEDVDDILEELHPQLSTFLNNKQAPEEGKDKTSKELLSGEEENIYACLSERPVHIDQIVDDTGYTIAKTSGILLQLELKKRVKQLPGKHFILS